jgi:hypothetical protein
MTTLLLVDWMPKGSLVDCPCCWRTRFVRKPIKSDLTSQDVQKMEAGPLYIHTLLIVWNNHWSMLLSSRALLAQALKDGLPWLLSGDDKQKQQQQHTGMTSGWLLPGRQEVSHQLRITIP